MAKYFYVSSEKMEEVNKVYPVSIIKKLKNKTSDGEIYTEMKTTESVFKLSGEINENIDKLESVDLIVWLEKFNPEGDPPY